MNVFFDGTSSIPLPPPRDEEPCPGLSLRGIFFLLGQFAKGKVAVVIGNFTTLSLKNR